MSVSSLHWRENRVREEINKQDLKQIDTSAHETGLPKSNGATFAPPGAKTRSPASREQKEKSPVTLDHLAAQKTFEVGQHVQAGQAGLSIAEPGVWTLANFKENQLGRIRPGQPVQIQVDAIPDRTFLGTVDSFQSGSGAVYALLPPDNATGNFTKNCAAGTGQDPFPTSQHLRLRAGPCAWPIY